MMKKFLIIILAVETIFIALFYKQLDNFCRYQNVCDPIVAPKK